MKVSIDLDGTAWSYRRVFAEIVRTFQAAGHQVGVVTAHTEDLREADLALWKARGFPDPDFFYNAEDIGYEGPVRDRKLAFIRAVGIDVHFDDFDNRYGDGEIEVLIAT